MATETTRYEVVQKLDDFEVRQYPGVIVAETEVQGDAEAAGSEGFSRLAGYIFGKNRGARKLGSRGDATRSPVAAEKIAMTAPVSQQPAGPRAFRIQFTMPAGYTLETLPEPLDPRVHLRALPPRRLAAIRYSGTWAQAHYEQELARLREGMLREHLAQRSEPIWARYDAPYVPWFLRTNEILIELDAAP